MRQRCSNPNNQRFNRYGARNIRVSSDWLEFKNFHRDMGDRPDGLSLERKDNNKGYCKSNCKWATIDEQSRNTSRNVFLTANKKTMIQLDWSRELGVSVCTIKKYLKKGRSFQWIYDHFKKA